MLEERNLKEGDKGLPGPGYMRPTDHLWMEHFEQPFSARPLPAQHLHLSLRMHVFISTVIS